VDYCDAYLDGTYILAGATLTIASGVTVDGASLHVGGGGGLVANGVRFNGRMGFAENASATLSGNTFTSGFKAWENNEQGIGLGSTLGTYFQIGNDQNNPTNSGGAVFSNMRFARGTAALEPIGATGNAIPEPGSLALLGTGLVSLLGLRRRK
jgi:hypothetical protein